MEQSDFQAFCETYATEEVCAQALIAIRWPTGFICPECCCSDAYGIQTRRLPLFECRNCRRQTSVTAGTIMDKSRTPLTKWFQAIYMLSRPDGISALRLSTLLSVTYKTAWLIAHKIRHAMENAEQSELLEGVVRVSFASYGYHHYLDAAHPLIVGASVDSNDQPVQLKIIQPSPSHVVERSVRVASNAALCEFANRYVHPRFAETDSEYPRKRIWKLVRHVWEANNWLVWTFNGIGAKHLQAYLSEYCFRFNAAPLHTSAITKVFRWATRTPKYTYLDLTRYRPTLAQPWALIGKNKWRGIHWSIGA